MGFLSQLFGNTKQVSVTKEEPFTFHIPWYSEPQSGIKSLTNPGILLTDATGLKISDIAPIMQICSKEDRPLILVTPGVDPSVVQLSGNKNLVAIKAAGLPDQPLASLLDDMAMVTGGKVLSGQLGFGFTAVGSIQNPTENGIILPTSSWNDLALADLGSADNVTIDHTGTTLTLNRMKKGDARLLAMLAASILQDEPSPGRNERLRRMGINPEKFPTQVQLSPQLQSEYKTIAPFRLASKYFITDPVTRGCAMDNALVAVLDEPLNDVSVAVRFLGHASVSGQPILIVAPSVSDGVLSVCVLNKMRGIVLCAVAIPGTQAGDSRIALANLARNTGSQVLKPSRPYSIPPGDISGLLGKVSRLRATFSNLAFTSTIDS